VAYRVSGGRLGERQLAYSVLLLRAVGRRTGKVRTHALLYVRAGDAFVVCASNYGAARHPAWYANLRANPRARIQVGRVHYDVVARTADGDERERLWHTLLGVRPHYARYQAATGRRFPLVLLTPIGPPSRGEGRPPALAAPGEGDAAMARYLFEPGALHAVALAHAGPPAAPRFAALIAALDARYPGQVHGDQPWLFSNAGGAMLQIKLLHASPREYLLLWGTPVGTEGHSGRHPVEYYDTVLHGEAWYYQEGHFEREVYRAGDRIYLGARQGAGIRVHESTWMLEYARGPVWRLLPFGLADSVFSTLDFATVGRTLRSYTTLVRRRARGAVDARGARRSAAALRRG
jgi:C-8 sterol isomerase